MFESEDCHISVVKFSLEELQFDISMLAIEFTVLQLFPSRPCLLYPYISCIII